MRSQPLLASPWHSHPTPTTRTPQDILEQFPAYTDCWLRLACIAKYTGDMAQALDYCQKAVEVPGGSADAQVGRGCTGVSLAVLCALGTPGSRRRALRVSSRR